MKYDIFISYKRKSLATANNLYYRLTTRGYSTFFDLEEMGRDNFNVQLLNYIENAQDVFVILEEGSLDACKNEDWEQDWFCHEIAFALEKKKNIIPILLGGYQMPSEEFFPKKLKELCLKNSPEFNFSFFEAYLDKLIEKEYLLSKPDIKEKTHLCSSSIPMRIAKYSKRGSWFAASKDCQRSHIIFPSHEKVNIDSKSLIMHLEKQKC